MKIVLRLGNVTHTIEKPIARHDLISDIPDSSDIGNDSITVVIVGSVVVRNDNVTVDTFLRWSDVFDIQ